MDAADDAGLTPLHVASALGHVACVQTLLAAGATATAVCGDDTWTALHLAASGAHAEVVKALLANAPRAADAKSASGLSAADVAAIAAEVNTDIAPLYDVIAPILGCE